jgi:hypothetical protein
MFLWPLISPIESLVPIIGWCRSSTVTGLVGQTCRFAPIKKPPCLPMLPSKNPHELNPFPGIQPAHGVLQLLSVSTGVHPWLRIMGSSVTLAKNMKTTKRTQFEKCKSPIKH